MTKTVTQTTPTSASPCTGVQLSGKFAAVPGSAAAGQVEYLLTLRNTSGTPCYVFGLPQAEILSTSQAPLPTHIAAGQAGSTPLKVVIAPGRAAVAQARFSPDVPGQGDNQNGPCQPKAGWLRVTPDGGGTVDAPFQPSVSVCERGTLYFDTFALAT